MDQRNEPHCSNATAAAAAGAAPRNERPAVDDHIIPSHTSNVHIHTPNVPKSFILVTATASCEAGECSNPLIIKPSHPSPVTCQTRSNLPSPISLVPCQPPTLFIQALSKLNESSISLAVISKLKSSPLGNGPLQSGEITPPDSLASAPPSYSFVLRQMAARRRPRLMGTFIPSPSFVQHTPPPNYATAFDIYVDNPAPPPPTRVYNFGFASMPTVCPECGYAGMTVVTTKITLCTHMCAFLLCIFCCWICVPLPYILRSCKDVYHHCRGCRNFLGMYCPTNPDNTSFA